MISKRLAALAALAGATLAQSSGDLATVLNATDGASTIGQVVSQLSGFLDAIDGKTNLTFIAPNDTAIAQFLNSSQGRAASDAGDDYLVNLLLYHTINGGYKNITDYFVAHTLLTSNALTNVSGGQFVGAYYDDDENVTSFLSADYNTSDASLAPLSFAQGWIYIIDSVLSIPEVFSEVAVAKDFNGTSFAAALDNTGLTEQFNWLHDVTYFLPLDAGWATVDEALAQLSKDNLTEVLKYHVADQILLFDDWTNGTQVTTLQGQTITFTQTPDEEWFVNNAGVSGVDYFSSGGVVVLLDSVLNPYSPWAPPRNGTDGDGVPAWPVSNATSTGAGGSSTASATGSVATATYTGASVPLKVGAVGTAVFLGHAALSLLF
ncbi:FAS1 domain-containing protein [Rhizodiscina lignyota]|uniref:FAS1 domain-containing protein n=1 Tax=Rhizodiscina lignyota TaxID=1504668 RepID=A0A9P4M5R5_9PEZI|nr:FAS1 domain-containing protein [Rhizodiscina lignyota]